MGPVGCTIWVVLTPWDLGFTWGFSRVKEKLLEEEEEEVRGS